MTIPEAAGNAGAVVTYFALAAFSIAAAAINAGREQYHNYRRWPGL